MKHACSIVVTAYLLVTFGSAATAGTACTNNYVGLQPALQTNRSSTALPRTKAASRDDDKNSASSTGADVTKTVVDVAASAGSFNVLIAAFKSAGLMDTLKGDGPFTIFAPTDAAFARLPEGTLDALLADKPRLIQVLTYHVVPGKLGTDALGSSSQLDTVAGSSLPVVNINIAEADITAANGVIHKIDQVLIPES